MSIEVSYTFWYGAYEPNFNLVVVISEVPISYQFSRNPKL